MDARHSTSPSIRRKAEAPADLAEVVDEAAGGQVLEVQVLVRVLPAEAQGLVLPVPAGVPAEPGSVAAATRLQLRVEAAVRPFPA